MLAGARDGEPRFPHMLDYDYEESPTGSHVAPRQNNRPPQAEHRGQGAVTTATRPAGRVAGLSGLPASRRLFLACKIRFVHGPASIILHPEPIGFGPGRDLSEGFRRGILVTP